MIDIITGYIAPFLFVLTVLVFFHELGHYLIARRCGVRVEVFSVGFGPEIKGWTDSHGTRWKISWIPLGGYVKMLGETAFGDEDKDEQLDQLSPEDAKQSFQGKSLAARAAIVAAGPIANFLLAIVLLAGIFGFAGSPAPLAGVGEVNPGSAAEAAGIQAGDRIVALDAEPIKWFEDLRRVVRANPGSVLQARVRRDDHEIALRVTPTPLESTEPDGSKVSYGMLGVRPDPKQIEYQRHGPLDAMAMGVTRTAAMVGQILSYIGEMVSGARGPDELGGPIRIAQLSGQMAEGGWVNLLFFMAALSVNLGLINLFPIPMLDGGHLVFYAVEALRGRPLGLRAQEVGFRMGLVLVLLLMVFATWNDLEQLEVFEFFRKLIT